MDDEHIQVSSRGLPRRSFLVSIGGAILGRFMLPPLPGETTPSEASGTVLTNSSDDKVVDMARDLLTKPVWNKRTPNVLCWLEKRRHDGKICVMCWHLETDEERTQGQRFSDFFTWKRWETDKDLQAILRHPGQWLVRFNVNYDQTYRFLVTADQVLIVADGEIHTDDPAKGVLVNSSQALQMIPWLNNSLGSGPHESIYYEPVRPEDAMVNFREAWFRSGE